MPFNRDQMKTAAAALAAQGIFLGTSSWKYAGWRGQLYDECRYIWRGRFAESRFERLCLAEYAEVFKTVCVDAAYYKFPGRDSLAELVGDGLTGVITSEADVPADLDDTTLVLVNAWLITQSPAFVSEMADPARFGQSWESLESGVGQL